VYQADTGYQDQGAPISADLKTAFNYFKSRGINKLFTMIRPLISTSGNASFLVGINVDFENTAPTGTIQVPAPTNSLWGSATWDSGIWSNGDIVIKSWAGIGRVGMCAAARLIVQVDGSSCEVNSFDMMAEPGASL
jgi:hypothetical protein